MDNDEFLTDLPTRDGASIGKSAERRMLTKALQSPFQTAIRENLDGSVTTLRTRGGSPEFVTSAAPNTGTALRFFATPPINTPYSTVSTSQREITIPNAKVAKIPPDVPGHDYTLSNDGLIQLWTTSGRHKPPQKAKRFLKTSDAEAGDLLKAEFLTAEYLTLQYDFYGEDGFVFGNRWHGYINTDSEGTSDGYLHLDGGEDVVLAEGMRGLVGPETLYIKLDGLPDDMPEGWRNDAILYDTSRKYLPRTARLPLSPVGWVFRSYSGVLWCLRIAVEYPEDYVSKGDLREVGYFIIANKVGFNTEDLVVGGGTLIYTAAAPGFCTPFVINPSPRGDKILVTTRGGSLSRIASQDGEGLYRSAGIRSDAVFEISLIDNGDDPPEALASETICSGDDANYTAQEDISWPSVVINWDMQFDSSSYEYIGSPSADNTEFSGDGYFEDLRLGVGAYSNSGVRQVMQVRTRREWSSSFSVDAISASTVSIDHDTPSNSTYTASISGGNSCNESGTVTLLVNGDVVHTHHYSRAISAVGLASGGFRYRATGVGLNFGSFNQYLGHMVNVGSSSSGSLVISTNAGFDGLVACESTNTQTMTPGEFGSTFNESTVATEGLHPGVNRFTGELSPVILALASNCVVAAGIQATTTNSPIISAISPNLDVITPWATDGDVFGPNYIYSACWNPFTGEISSRKRFV